MIRFIQEYTGYNFLQPNWFYLLLLLPIIVWGLYKLTKKKPFGVKYTHTPEQQLELFSVFVWTYRYLILSAKVLLFVLFTIILAQPFKINSTETPLNQKEYGIDLIFVLDVSLSMLAMDLQPNRLESAKKVISNF